MHIRKDDMVVVLTGDDRGTRAKVLRVLPKRGKLIVEGVNRVYKHMRRSRQNTQGGRLSKEMPIDASNVQLICPSCGEAARTGLRLAKEGAKERYCKKCSATIREIAPARKTTPKA